MNATSLRWSFAWALIAVAVGATFAVLTGEWVWWLVFGFAAALAPFLRIGRTR